MDASTHLLQQDKHVPDRWRAAQLPTVAELEAATAATEAVYADPEATYADLLAVLEAEEAAYCQVFTGPCDRPVPEPEAEAEAEAGL